MVFPLKKDPLPCIPIPATATQNKKLLVQEDINGDLSSNTKSSKAWLNGQQRHDPAFLNLSLHLYSQAKR